MTRPNTTYYTNTLADAPEAVRWVHPVNATVGGAAGGTVVKTDDGAWSAGAVGSRALAESPGAFQGALSWPVPAGWANHFFLGLVGADAPAADPAYATFTLGAYLNLDASSFDVYAAGTPRYQGRLVPVPVRWRPGATVEVQVWRAAGGGFEGRFLLDDRLVYTLPLPALAFPLSPRLSLHGAAGQAAGGFVLRGPALVPSGYAQLPAGALAWWRADAGLRLDEAGGLARWADQSGHGRDLYPAPGGPAPRPVAWAGAQALAFDGQPALAPLDLGLPAPPAVLTTVQVLQMPSDATNLVPLAFGADGASANGLRVLYNYLGLNVGDDAVYGTRRADELLGTGPVVLAAEWPSAHPEDFRLWLNGRPLLVGPHSGSVAAHPLGSLLHLAGPAPGMAGGRWQGWLAETLLYDRALPDATHAELADALALRYALTRDAGLEWLDNSSFRRPAVAAYGPDWFAQPRWAVGGGRATMQGGQNENGPDYLYQDTDLEVGATYQVEFEVAEYTSGTFLVNNSAAGSLREAAFGVGVHRYRFVNASTTQRWHLGGGQNAHYSLAYFSLRQVAPDPYHPATASLPAAGLRLHLRPDRGLLRAPDGSLAQWADQSPYGLTVRPEGGPAAFGAAPLAGGQALYFNGGQALLPVDLSGPPPTVLTAVLLLQIEPGLSSKMPIHFGDGNNQDLWLDSDHFGLNTYNSDILGIANATAQLSQPVLVVAEVHSNEPRRFRLWLNGAAQPVAQQQSQTLARPLENRVRLGGNAQWRWQGWLGEMALYDRALTADEQQRVFAAVRSRYPGLPAYVAPAPPLAPTPDPTPPAATDVPASPLGWWRAASGLTRDAAGSVASWADRSGHDHPIYADGANAAPTMQAWAGGRALYFNGQQALDFVDVGTAPAVRTVALLLQAEAGANSIMPVHFGAGYNQDLWLNNDSFGLNTYASDVLGIANANAQLGRPVLVVAELHSGDPAGFRLWLNGVAQPVAPQQGQTQARGFDTLVRLGGAPGWLWHGWLAEALLYDRPLTEAEQQQLVAYVRGQYTL
ncbi:hypothetical protein GCM10027422_43700 [Hymenobacter arcticus]